MDVNFKKFKSGSGGPRPRWTNSKRRMLGFSEDLLGCDLGNFAVCSCELLSKASRLLRLAGFKNDQFSDCLRMNQASRPKGTDTWCLKPAPNKDSNVTPRQKTDCSEERSFLQMWTMRQSCEETVGGKMNGFYCCRRPP